MELVVRDPDEAALRELHHDDRVDTEDVGRQRQAAQDDFGHAPAGVADDMRLTEVKTGGGGHLNAGVHARQDGEAPAGPAGSDVGAGRDVAILGGQEPDDLFHLPQHGRQQRQDGHTPCRGPSRSVLDKLPDVLAAYVESGYVPGLIASRGRLAAHEHLRRLSHGEVRRAATASQLPGGPVRSPT